MEIDFMKCLGPPGHNILEAISAEIKRTEETHRPMLEALVTDLRATYGKHLTAEYPVDPGQVIDLARVVIEVAMEDWSDAVEGKGE